ncbi:hypothetical protein [Paenibacillus segetis]|uniref:VCBS repeat-containing protein n=1 Tax=Paenibacillus segetis TaxID=1325360 RepID=A0ABQ1Y7Y0_9BACL|nr:hypothetical protein [Paenibacillus segetis]GGH15231.1 hypothetical protein GCM10008013_09300 [Paenibacillus segetis]
MKSELRIGIFIFILMMAFSLLGCSTNNSQKDSQASKEDLTAKVDSAASDIDKCTQIIQNIFGTNLKYRGTETIKGSSDELYIFYADAAEGFDSLTYKLNVRTGTVSDGTSGMPLYNIQVESSNLNELDFESYKVTLKKIVVPLITSNGYKLDSDDLDAAFLGFIGDGNIEYQVKKNDAPYVIQVEPFLKEVKGMGEVAADIAVTGDFDENSDIEEQDSEQTLEGLQEDGFTIIEEQSFWVDLNNWGNVRFVSGYYTKNKVQQLQFFIINSDKVVLCALPKSYSGTHQLENIQAVSFKDMNGDGYKDIILIGNNNLASVFFYSWESFIQLPWYDDIINDSGNNNTIAAIVREGQKLLQKIQSPNISNENDESEIERLASLISNKKLLDLGDLDYADLSASLVVFSSSSTYSEGYITGLVSNYFEEDTARVAFDDETLRVNSEKYDALSVDIIGDIITYNYIESGGGTIWSLIHSYSALEAKVAINRYVKGNTLGDQGALRTSLSSLLINWNQLRKEMQKVIEDEGFLSGDYSIELKDGDLEEIVDLKERLDHNISDFIKQAAHDKQAKILVDLINNNLNIGLN